MEDRVEEARPDRLLLHSRGREEEAENLWGKKRKETAKEEEDGEQGGKLRGGGG